MRTLSTIHLKSVVISFSLTVALLVPVAAAQQSPSGTGSPPPELGPLVVEDPLTAPGVIQAEQTSFCPIRRNVREFVGEGYILKVRGTCVDARPDLAVIGKIVPGLTLPDGDVRLEMRAVSGQDRAVFLLRVRVHPVRDDEYHAEVQPARGRAALRKLLDGQGFVLAERSDLADMLAPDGWNDLAVRTQGPNLWLLLNDQPILAAVDSTYETGGVAVGLHRLGDPNDEQESAVVLRSLNVSALADRDPTRAPTYQRP